ncbi:MAG: restriction endonuclease, partial [Acidobacteria bacterium]|nr:restriction endonuclease [Acidobacteriota bacterium]
ERFKMPIPEQKRSGRGVEFEYLLAEVFRRAGWHVVHQPSLADRRADLVVDAGDKKYVVELKSSAEGRRDRLIPLLSQAILQAQAVARSFPEPVIPVAVVSAPHVPDSVAGQIKDFAMRHAPEIGIGVIDSEGLCAFFGHGLEQLSAKPSASPRMEFSSGNRSSFRLFSDLNQWMLKILLSANLPESLLSAPRGRYENASQLAQAAGVSVMSAFRLLRELSNEGFLDERLGALHLVRIEELMQQWSAASQRNAREFPLRWIIPGRKDQLTSAIKSYLYEVEAGIPRSEKARDGRLFKAAPRVCIGLFAAAEALGFGFAKGILPHVYLERPEANAIKRLGLSAEDAERRADVYMRVPRNNVAVFRGSVSRNGLPVSDVIQVWLDVSNHPARGKEQADYIWRRILAPSFRKEER